MKMLICSIGSEQCNVTLRFGTAVAKALSADTTLLGMVKEGDKAEQLRGALNKVSKELAELGLPVQVRLETGDAEKIVMTELEQNTYDLVAVGALGNQRSRHTVLDLVGMRIIERAAGSVLVIKGDRPTLSRVLICSSGTEHSRLPVRTGAAVACGAGAQVTLLHVMDPLPAMYAGLEGMEETLAEFLQTDTDIARELKWAVGVVEAECENAELELRHGIVADELLREGQAGDHDLIVLGSSRSAGGLIRVLLGDLTQAVVTRAQRPVLVVRSADWIEEEDF
jgi:nucleotide-binding universal stress UspA family protein